MQKRLSFVDFFSFFFQNFIFLHFSFTIFSLNENLKNESSPIQFWQKKKFLGLTRYNFLRQLIIPYRNKLECLSLPPKYNILQDKEPTL